MTRPLEERIRLYETVSDLFLEGMRRGEIVSEMRARFGEDVNPTTVIDWTERGISPYGRVHRFDCVPTPELAYVLGVKLGDATQSKGTWQHNYMIKLLTIDKEFADEFSRCAAVVLNCKPFKVWRYAKRRAWCTTVGSIMLYGFLERGLSGFRRFVEHCPDCVRSFLRGFLDSEAGVGKAGLTFSNGNYHLLVYVQHLLAKFFQIETTGPHIHGPPPGTSKLIRGRLVSVNMQNYTVRVRMRSLPRLEQSVGFSILRKRESLHGLVASRLLAPATGATNVSSRWVWDSRP